MTNWREILEEAMKKRGESLTDIVSITLTSDELDAPFDGGFGGTEGVPFTAWTANSVYFPACYDGAEWVEAVSRNPDGKPTFHVGGG